VAKPTLEEARWGETAGGTPSANLIEPTSGKKDAGWVDDEQPDAEQVNWTLRALYLWAKYVDGGVFDGVISFPDGLSAGTSLEVDTATAVDLSAAGSIALPARREWLSLADGAVPVGVGAGAVVYDDGHLAMAADSYYDVPINLCDNDSISHVAVYFKRVTGGSFGATLFTRSLTGAGDSAQVYKDMSGGTGSATSSDLGTSPTSGSLPYTVSVPVYLRLTCPAGSTAHVYAVSVTHAQAA